MEASFSILMLITSVLALSTAPSLADDAKPKVTAMYVFGDSLIDNGNNIYFVVAVAKAKFWPYGIDFDKGPTGRFCNGKTLVDYIGELLGLPLIPSYADANAKGENIMYGVNYASAGSGILEDTGDQLGRLVPLREQISNFESTLNQLKDQMQTEDLSDYLAKAIVFLDMGSNDYLNNYLFPFEHQSSKSNSPQEFADLLVKQYEGHILELQKLGVRKFFIAEVAPIGCIPFFLGQGKVPPGECEPSSNNLAQMFNSRLKPLVNRLNSENPGSVFSLGGSFKIFMTLRDNADDYGFTVKDKPCCDVGINKRAALCRPYTEPCFNREQYLFWDNAHPTQAANRLLAHWIFNSTTYNFPFSIQKLAEM
ncbi:GDSL esterase/lipase [Striga hermonthica]|uniref:GDSL esterase/lipase n=1 Tax=Striga hermonthica TaxID=68872 RepID=A0A9N7NW01_STRHE|nr:GDSL esterase/lipase [Striga hermonthica]